MTLNGVPADKIDITRIFGRTGNVRGRRKELEGGEPRDFHDLIEQILHLYAITGLQ